jgi:hypothetical protein
MEPSFMVVGVDDEEQLASAIVPVGDMLNGHLIQDSPETM